jgi:hypothetical protein
MFYSPFALRGVRRDFSLAFPETSLGYSPLGVVLTTRRAMYSHVDRGSPVLERNVSAGQSTVWTAGKRNVGDVQTGCGVRVKL